MSRGSEAAYQEQPPVPVLSMKPGNESPPGKLRGRRDRVWGLVIPKATTRIGCTNVTSLCKEEGREVLAARTFVKYNLDVCGLSEVRWLGKGKEKIGEYTLFYSGDKDKH